MKKSLLSIIFMLAISLVHAQEEDDLLSLLGDEKTTDYATASFKTNRVINGHSIENTAKGVLDFKISHRFTSLGNGIYDLFGLDGASIRFGFDYGITDRLMIGVGRSTFQKTFDGFAKYKILRQSSGKKVMPLSVSYLIDAQIESDKPENDIEKEYFSSKVFYVHQLLIARKMNERLTLQLMPTIVHRNLTENVNDKNDVLALGIAGRLKLTKRVSLNAEYYYVLPDQITTKYANSLSLGFDIETGGHVFQLHFTNSQPMTHKGFITQTENNWFYKGDDGRMLTDLRFGFNVSRVFSVNRPKVK